MIFTTKAEYGVRLLIQLGAQSLGSFPLALGLPVQGGAGQLHSGQMLQHRTGVLNRHLADARELARARDDVDGRRLAGVRSANERDLSPRIVGEIGRARSTFQENGSRHEEPDRCLGGSA